MFVSRAFRYAFDTARIVVKSRYVWLRRRLNASHEVLAATSSPITCSPGYTPGFAPIASRSSQKLEDHVNNQRVLVIDTCYPTPDRDSGSLRMFNMLALLREFGCTVQFMTTQRYEANAYTHALEQLGVELIDAESPLRRLRWWYRHGATLDVVVLSRLPVAMRHMRHARRYAERAKLIFDTVDLHFLRVGRGAALQHDNELALQAEKMKQDELGLMRKADLTLVVSDYELGVLHRLVPSAPLAVLSNVHEVYGRAATFEERAGLIFLGNFEHEPNIDAARMLIDEVMPILAQTLPDVVLHIVGHAAHEALGQPSSDNVCVHGYVADLTAILAQVRVAVAPLRYGAGVKGKINMAMSHGVPVVATPIGVEGMRLIHGEDVMVAEGAAAFASAVAVLHQDESAWLTLSDKGLENVRRHFSLDAGRKAVARILDPKR